MNGSDRTSSNTLLVRVSEDFVLNAGSWRRSIGCDGSASAHVDPPSPPMVRQVTEYLDAKPTPGGGPVRLADEARAAVAACLRWGSYFAVLTDSSRPFSPDIHDETVSQIGDDEMARMNMEISSAIQWWLTLKGSDRKRYAEFVQRVLAYLPLGSQTVTRWPEGDILRECAMPAMADAVWRAWPVERLEQDLRVAETHGVRVIANSMALLCWRNGPVERVHEGHSSGYAFQQRRMLLREERAIVRQAQNVLYGGLQAMEYMLVDGAWPPPPGRVLPFMRPFCYPRSWTYTEQDRVVEVPLRAHPAHKRL